MLAKYETFSVPPPSFTFLEPNLSNPDIDGSKKMPNHLNLRRGLWRATTLPTKFEWPVYKPRSDSFYHVYELQHALIVKLILWNF